jgi:hypothetical protein
MKSLIDTILDRPLRETLSNSNLSGDEMLEVVESMISLKETLDKNKDKTKTFNRTTAAKYLRISDSSFRNKVLSGELPEGIKVVGQGKIWYKEDLDNYVNKYANKKKN